MTIVNMVKSFSIAEKKKVIIEGLGQGGSTIVLKKIAPDLEKPVKVEVRDESSKHLYHAYTAIPKEKILTASDLYFLQRPGDIGIYVADWRGLIDLGDRKPAETARLSETELGEEIIESLSGTDAEKKAKVTKMLDEILANDETILFAQKEAKRTKDGALTATKDVDTGNWRVFSDGRLLGPVFNNPEHFSAIASQLTDKEKEYAAKQFAKTGRFKLPGRRKSFINRALLDGAVYTVAQEEADSKVTNKIIGAPLAFAFYVASPDGGTGTAIAEAHADMMNITHRQDGFQFITQAGEEIQWAPVEQNVQFLQYLVGTLPKSTEVGLQGKNTALRLLNAVYRAYRVRTQASAQDVRDIAIDGDILFSRAGAFKARLQYLSENKEADIKAATDSIDAALANYLLDLSHIVTQPKVTKGTSQRTLQELRQILSGIILPASITHTDGLPGGLDNIVKAASDLLRPVSINPQTGHVQGLYVDATMPENFVDGKRATAEDYLAQVFSRFAVESEDGFKLDVNKINGLRTETMGLDPKTIPPEFFTPTYGLLFINGPNLTQEQNFEDYTTIVEKICRLAFPNLKDFKVAAGWGPENRTSLAVGGGSCFSYETLGILYNNLGIYPSFNKEQKTAFLETFINGKGESLDKIIPEAGDVPFETDRLVSENMYNRACRDASLDAGKLLYGQGVQTVLATMYDALYNREALGKLTSGYEARAKAAVASSPAITAGEKPKTEEVKENYKSKFLNFLGFGKKGAKITN